MRAGTTGGVSVSADAAGCGGAAVVPPLPEPLSPFVPLAG